MALAIANERRVQRSSSRWRAGVSRSHTQSQCSAYARVITQLAGVHHPSAVLFGATTTGRDLAPRVAAMLNTGLAADCTDLVVAPWTRRGAHFDALLHQIRPAMAGGVLATCVCPESRPQMATVRPGVFELHPAPRQARIETVQIALEPTDLRVEVIDRETSTADVGLTDADVIIAGGAGCDASSWGQPGPRRVHLPLGELRYRRRCTRRAAQLTAALRRSSSASR